MPIEQDMINILRNSATRQINFSFSGTSGGSVTVNQTSFNRIVDGLSTNKFEITSDGVPSGRAAYNPKADSKDKSGIFKINPGGIPLDFESLVVHESVHASFDLTRSVLLWVDNEAAAHIAQGWYYHLNNITPEMVNIPPIKQGIIVAAELAQHQQISEANLTALRQSLLVAPPYQRYIHTTFRGNG